MKQVLYLLITLISIQSFSANYYVDDVSISGNGSLNSPFNKIQDALDIALGGDTVFIREGVYYESYLEPNSGSSNNW